MGGSKNVSESTVSMCEQNPRMAFLVIPLGLVLVFWGIKDAKYYQTLRDKPTRQMKVVDVHDATNSRGFSIPHVFGETADGEVSFPVSSKASRRIQPGEQMQIVETTDPGNPYMTRDSLDSQLSSIYFSVGGQPINHIAILGIVLALGALGWGLFGKPKLAETPSKETASSTGKSK